MWRQRGFTLLEVIVAFAMLALALTLLLGSMSGAARQIRHADRASHATLHAQTLMAQIGVGEPLRPMRREGVLENGAYRWILDVTPYVDSAVQRQNRAAALRQQPGPQLLQLDLTVRWGEGPSEYVQWQTLRLSPLSGGP
ncbi:MAG: prepilin-type N-terminal cleavage/methylation domain-containing protein [Xanthomonadaceae bacterium]|jgi:general secretion pathway protein I|nr:prepilin-type N-terminal cleavage/methylation domain-containing protein [Xanthomonadaceae bacterium]